jgi:ketosteroid isomerase-like protein
VSVSANLDLVRSIYEHWERGDFSSTEWADPEIEFVTIGGLGGRWTGLVGMEEGFREWRTAWEELRIKVDEYRALDEERVLVLYHRSGRGKTSGLDLAQFRSDGAALLRVRDGKVTSLVSYADREHALTDLGLEA